MAAAIETESTKLATGVKEQPAAVSVASIKRNLKEETSNRHKTAGERIFDIGTYGGITWILNEVISAWAGGKIQGSVTDPHTGAIIQKAGTLNASFNEKVAGFKSFLNIPKDKYPRLVDRPLKILYLCIGGTAVVPLVKWLEGHKSGIVHAVNNRIYGERAQSDPHIVEAQREMDEAPKQTWGSLLKGRLLVMGTAIALDGFVGHDGAPVTRLFENTQVKNYANMERAGTTLARDILSHIHPSAEKRAIIKEMRKTNPSYISAQEGKAAQFAGGTFGFVTILSGALTVLFYVSSRIFAFNRVVRKEAKAIETHHVVNPVTGDFRDNTAQDVSTNAPGDEKTPKTKLSSIEAASPLLANAQAQAR